MYALLCDNDCHFFAIARRALASFLDFFIRDVCSILLFITDIFKVRSGQWTQVRIWSNVDLGIMRKKDLFLTDSRLEPIEGFFERAEYHIENWDEGEKTEVDRIVDELNEGVIDEL